MVRNKVEPVLYTVTNQLDVSCVDVPNCARLATFIEIESRCVRGGPREIIDLNVEKEGQDVFVKMLVPVCCQPFLYGGFKNEN